MTIFASTAVRIFPGSGRRTAIERTHAALAARPFSPRGRRAIFNLRGGFKALRSLLSFPLVQHPQKSGRSGFHRFVVPKVLSCLPSLHAHTRAWRSERDAQRKPAFGA